MTGTAQADDAVTIGEALARHYMAHGLAPNGGEDNPWFDVQIGPLRIPLPNPPARRRAVFFHDVNHVLTGYNTRFADGEMAIAGFEVGAGCGRALIAWFINLVLMAVGLVLRPRTTYRAFIRGGRSASIYERREQRGTMLAMSVGDMRKLVAVAPPFPAVAANARETARFVAWSSVALVLVVAMFALFAGAAWIAVAAVRAALP
ncbi:MAG: hypothetical protein ACT4P7_12720 [Gemmatimonadaceae bacterium]